MTARVEDFSLPETFGMQTAFSVMDGFTRAQYPDRFREKRRESWDIMLDHRLNPDDISRTTPPEIGDLVHARSRGMNRFNILNIVPPPKDPKRKWVCAAPREATEKKITVLSQLLLLVLKGNPKHEGEKKLYYDQ